MKKPHTPNLQDAMLNEIRKGKIETVVFTTNGAQIRGNIVSYDNFTILVLNERGQLNLLYKHAISTIAPQKPIDFSDILHN